MNYVKNIESANKLTPHLIKYEILELNYLE